jgi:N-acetylmuramic acid 6-phosphate etherase
MQGTGRASIFIQALRDFVDGRETRYCSPMTSSKWERLRTEAANPATKDIDTLPTDEIVQLMTSDVRDAFDAVQRVHDVITRGVDVLVDTLHSNGRIVLVGAGTSGRLGVLEAAEMPPTFGVQPRTIVGIMAGGRSAVHRAKEGVEDDRAAGDRALARLRLTKNDVVIGVSASGVTPFVRGALARARRAGAHAMGITCSPDSGMRALVDLLVELNVGPEVIAGSTRLKAGTATKIALNLLTTSAMIRTGKTYGNLMVDVQANSEKLRDRGTRIVSAITGLGRRESLTLLRRAKWNVKTAIVMHKRRLTYGDAKTRLRASGDSIRRALVED